MKRDYIYKDLLYPLVETWDGYKPVFNLKLYKPNNCFYMKPFALEMEHLEEKRDKIKGKKINDLITFNKM